MVESKDKIHENNICRCILMDLILSLTLFEITTSNSGQHLLNICAIAVAGRVYKLVRTKPVLSVYQRESQHTEQTEQNNVIHKETGDLPHP